MECLSLTLGARIYIYCFTLTANFSRDIAVQLGKLGALE